MSRPKTQVLHGLHTETLAIPRYVCRSCRLRRAHHPLHRYQQRQQQQQQRALSLFRRRTKSQPSAAIATQQPAQAGTLNLTAQDGETVQSATNPFPNAAKPLPRKPRPTSAPNTAPGILSKLDRQRPHAQQLWNRTDHGELVPQPLVLPLGVAEAPQPGQNSGRDVRSLRQRWRDFLSPVESERRRNELLTRLYTRGYWRDVGNLGKKYRGKSMIAPASPFRAGVAQFFPNLQGHTLEKYSRERLDELASQELGGETEWTFFPKSRAVASRDTTPVLRGKISVLSMVHTMWAVEQVNTFVGKDRNPELWKYLDSDPEAKGLVQRVLVNVEENPIRHALVRLYTDRQRRMTPEEDWQRSFLVRRGLSDELRDAMGMWNSKVGYVYLIDAQCRIRWASNGDARDEERQRLVASLKRLVEEHKEVQRIEETMKIEARPTEQDKAKEKKRQETMARRIESEMVRRR